VKCTEMITWMVRQAHKMCTKLIPDVSEISSQKGLLRREYPAARLRSYQTRHGTDAIRVLARSAGLVPIRVAV
jgi:hypothetical protein